MPIKRLKRLLCLFLSFLSIFGVRSQGVLFSRYRIILNENAITSMYMTNPTEETLAYTISFVNKRMNENGELIDVSPAEEPDFSIRKYLRVFPRSIVLEPGKSQEVQIQLKAPVSLSDGEYRSFINFSPREPSHQTDEEEQEGVKMSIQFNIGSAIPIIYRKNAIVEEIVIDDVSLSPKKNDIRMLNMNLKRKGTRSVYGKIVITGISGGKEVSVDGSEGTYAIYCEIPFLRVSIPVKIDNLDRDHNNKVKLHIFYVDSEKQDVRKPLVWTEREVELLVPL